LLTGPCVWCRVCGNAEVGLLTRRILLKGDTSTVGPNEETFGGHVLMRKVADAEIVGVELTKMGQVTRRVQSR
jgi:hypothetical protein